MYAIPVEDYDKAAKFFELHFSKEFELCRQFIRHKVILVNPKLLIDAGIRVHLIIQEPGTIIVNMPGCLHFGFNEYWNEAIAYNVCTDVSLPYLIDSKACECSDQSIVINHRKYMKQYLQKDEYINYKKFLSSLNASITFNTCPQFRRIAIMVL